MKVGTILAGIAALCLCGCALKTFTTSGPVGAPLGSSALHVVYEPPGSAEMLISKSGGGERKIDEAEKARAWSDAQALNRLFMGGLKEKFPVDAAKYGLAVRSGDEAAATLKVRIIAFSTRCNAAQCLSTARVRGELFNPSGFSVWKFVAVVGGASVYSPEVTQDAYDEFEKELFAQMQSDSVIARK